jgi:hypothetical protein
MTRDLDLIKIDVDLIANVILLRGTASSSGAQGGDPAEDDGF